MNYPEQESSSLNWIDLKSARLLNKVRIGTVQRKIGHFNMSRDGWVTVVGLHFGPGAPSFAATVDPGGTVTRLAVPDIEIQDFLKESLNIALNEDRGHAIVTCPLGSRIYIWNYRTQEFVKALKTAKPKGILYRPRQNDFIVTHYNRGISILSADTYELKEISSSSAALGGCGAHLSRSTA